MSLLLAGAIAGGATLAGQAVNAYSAGRMNKRAEKFSWAMYDKQRQDATSDWDKQNSYNSPTAQMQRLEEAGLNPHLVYGNGATTEASMPRASSAPAPTFKAPQLDLGSVVHSAMASKQLQASIAQTEAQTDAIKMQTESGMFDLRVKQVLGMDRIVQEADNKLAMSDAKTVKEIEETNTWLDVMLSNAKTGNIGANAEYIKHGSMSYMKDSNPLIRKVMHADVLKTVEELSNLRKSGILRDDQHTINQIEIKLKDFQQNLSKLGVSPTSIQAISVIAQIFKSIFGK